MFVVLMLSFCGSGAPQVVGQQPVNDKDATEVEVGADADAALATELERLIEQLDSPRFADRHGATQRLQALGEAAYPALTAAMRSPSAEVRARVTWILRDTQEKIIRTAFSEFSRNGGARLDVEQGMWLIARILNPGVRRKELTEPLDRLADKVRTRLAEKVGNNLAPEKADPQVVMQTLHQVVFVEEGFNGAQNDYTNPENSSLEFVLSKRRGLPILLSHLVIGVAERLRLPVVGVPTGGRYLVKYDGTRAPEGFARDDRFMDPFDGGRVYENATELSLAFPGLLPQDLPGPASGRQILIRMLNNLESHLYHQGNIPKAELTVACRVILMDGSLSEDE